MTKIKSIFLISFFLLSLHGCTEEEPDKKTKGNISNKKTGSNKKSTKKSNISKKKQEKNTKSLINIVKLKEGEVPIPPDVLAWAVISPQHGLIVEKVVGKTINPSIFPYVYVFYIDEQGKVVVLRGAARKSGSANCYPKGKFCYNYPESITPPAKFKTFKWKLGSSRAQINFSGRNSETLQKKFPKLQMLELAKFKFAFDGKNLQGTAFGKKGKVNEYLQNGFYYVKQLALKEKMYLLRFGKNGRQVAASLLKATIKPLKRGRIRFMMELRADDVGWIFKKLNNLFKIL
ncbi:MAG: hypothetical protein PF689_07175 [Deltaproteobacteria bacterium]|jgi:hypothetical protein|nr:hypothetical protein [Deltaproteobacteria bacterium]